MSDPQSSPQPDPAPGVQPAASSAPGPDPARLDRLMLHVIDSISASNPDEGALEELLQALPDHPKVHQLAVCAAVIGFPWPLTRAPYVPADDRTACSRGDLELVFFHANRQDAASGFHDPIDYMGVLALSLESATITAPQARRVLLTDEVTPGPAAVCRSRGAPVYPWIRRMLMYERMRVQETYLRGPAGRAAARF